MNKTNLLFFMFITILVSSCLTLDKQVEYLKPAEITINKDINTIAILSAGYQYREEISDILFNVFSREAVRKRFTVVDRQNLNLILREQNLYNQDDFNDQTAVELGELAGANAIIIGAFKNVREDMTNGIVVIKRRYVSRTWVDDYGIKHYEYNYVDENVPSIIKSYFFTIDIRMLDIRTGTVIHTEQKSYQLQLENYLDNKPSNFFLVVEKNAPFVKVFPQMRELLMKEGKAFSDFFAKQVAPYYVTVWMSFEKIANDDINKKFIKFVTSDLFEEALDVMVTSLPAIESIEKEKFRAMHYYNMGCVYEVMSDFDNSLKYYTMAVKENPTSLHRDALREIKKRIEENRKLDEQLENGNGGDSSEDW